MKDKLRAYLKRRHITGRDFAKQIGRDAGTVSKILHGHVSFPDPDTQRAIIEATNGEITANDFLGIDEPNAPEASAAE
jgi:transcriptional regulator with XRE-family HTH domain